VPARLPAAEAAVVHYIVQDKESSLKDLQAAAHSRRSSQVIFSRVSVQSGYCQWHGRASRHFPARDRVPHASVKMAEAAANGLLISTYYFQVLAER
jgi:hypothetical protein